MLVATAGGYPGQRTRGFGLQPRMTGVDVALLVPPIAGEQASLLALLVRRRGLVHLGAGDLALDSSQRTVQRALVELEAAGHGALDRSAAA